MPRVLRLAFSFLLIGLLKATGLEAQSGIAGSLVREGQIAHSLSVKWALENNFYQGKRQTLSSFTFFNTGKSALPAAGWALYFNAASAPMVGKTAAGLLIQDMSGCLFKVSPTGDFKGLLPGDSLRMEFISADAAANISDAPDGLYLVWDDHPEKGISIGRYTMTPITNPALFDRYPGDHIPEATPGVIFDSNSVIADIPRAQLNPLFPTPLSYQPGPIDTVVYLGAIITIADTGFMRESTYLTGRLAALRIKTPGVGAVKQGVAESISLERVAPSTLPEEGYRLTIRPGQITIKASAPAGMFYGIQSLLQLFPVDERENRLGRYSLPLLTVTDQPRFGYRSVMIDVARNFQSQPELLRLIDLMAFCKLNVLHLHLTDDEGWRLEIPSLPELTSVGAKRGHTLDDYDFLRPCYGSGPDTTSATGSGFYTRAEFISLLQYARDRHIRVIPEIESPGHARAAVKSMDNRYRHFMQEDNREEALRYLLRDTADQSVYSTPQLYHDDVLNIALPSVYRFIAKVVDEITIMYREAGVPLETIHLGGDEVPGGVWEKSPACLALVHEHPDMLSVNDLWYYYFDKVDSILKQHGLYTSAWEEAGMRKTTLDGKPYILPNPDFAGKGMQVHIWNNGDGAEDLGYRMANSGYKVVLAVASNLYFDMAYNKSFDEFGYYWATFLDVDKPFGYIPFDFLRLLKVDEQGYPLPASFKLGKERLTDYGKSNITGIEGCLWGETLKGGTDMEYKMLPKLLGLAERAWSPDPVWATMKDTLAAESAYAGAWSVFVNTLGKNVLPGLDIYNGGYAYRIPTPGAVIKQGRVWANVQFPGLFIRYTTNGKEPDAKSKLYTGPIADKGQIRLRVFNSVGRGSRTVDLANE